MTWDNYDSVLQDTESHVMPNINERTKEDAKPILLDWQDNPIKNDEIVYQVKYKKNIGTQISGNVMVDDFLNTYLATDETLLDLLNEKDRSLYWGMEIFRREDLMEWQTN